MASSLRMAEMVSQLWPLRCSQATSRRRRVSDGNPRVRCIWRWAESTRSCFRSAAAAAGSQHAWVPVCIHTLEALQLGATSVQEAWVSAAPVDRGGCGVQKQCMTALPAYS